MPTFTVMVADNFHYMDANETYKYRDFATWEEAVTAAKAIVDDCLKGFLKPESTPETMLSQYTMFGEDPYIIPSHPNESFSAWDYAKKRCDELQKES